MRYHDRCKQHKSLDNMIQAEYNKFSADTNKQQTALLSEE